MKTTSLINSIRGHSFYAGLVNRDSVVVDLGAHRGEFSFQISKSFGCECYLVEALPSLFSQIAEGPLIHKYNFVMTGRDEPIDLFVAANPEGNTIIDTAADGSCGVVTLEGITLETLMAKAGINTIDLLKVDIEGAEIALLEAVSDATLANIMQLTVEFHDFVPGLVSAQQVQKIKERLQRLGFYSIRFSRTANTDVLFINWQRSNISKVEYWYIKYIIKYVRGIARILTSYYPHKAN